MSSLQDNLLKSRRRITILFFSILVGLNIVVVALYFSSTVINSIKEPLFQLSNSTFVATVLKTFLAPVFALLASIIGYYFGSRSTKGVHDLGNDDASGANAWFSSRSFEFLRPWKNGVMAAALLLSHVLIAAFMIGLIWGLEFLLTQIWEERHIQLFGRVPLSYLFDASKLGVLLTFLTFGALEAVRALRAPEGR